MMFKKFKKGMQFIDQISGTIGDAKAVKEGKGVQTIGGNILKKKAGNKFMKMFK